MIRLIIAILVFVETDAWQCHPGSTPLNEKPGGNFIYLDRHYLRCGSRGLVRFQLANNGDNMKYEYFCCDFPSKVSGQVVSKTTAYTSDGNGDTLFLDRQTVDCGSHGILTGFNIERNPPRDGHNMIRYHYQCYNVNHVQHLHCYEKTTPFVDDGHGDVSFLDKLNVQCNTNYYLNKFHLERGGGGHSMGYRYRCCQA